MISRFFLFLVAALEWLHNKWLGLTASSRIRFSCTVGDYWAGFHPQLTRLVQPKFLKNQVEKAKAETAAGGKGVVKFVRCPGMHDYTQEGYLILAHADIHIKANSVGCSIRLEGQHDQQLQPQPMDFGVIDGMCKIEGVPNQVTKIPLPYGIYMEPGHSAHLLPPLMHGVDYLDKIYIYPGTVDYDKFHVANVIITVLKPCEFVIPAGTPLLHVLPFKRISYHGVTGPATKKEYAKLKFGFPSRITGFYRKMFHSKKVYTNEVMK